jgi:hypothetical protein
MAIDLSSKRTIYRDITEHLGHHIVAVAYADGVNVAIECEDCSVVLLDADRPDPEDTE